MASILASEVPIHVSDNRKVNKNAFNPVPFFPYTFSIPESTAKGVYSSVLTDHKLCSKSIMYVGIRI